MKPILFNTEMVRAILDGRKAVTRRVVKPQPKKEVDKIALERFHNPYRPGDILYVPEPWKCRKCPNTSTLGYEVVFKDGSIIKFQFADRKRFDKWKKYWDKPDNQWKSPYFMPGEAARIFLRVTGVRVERLQEITEEQAQAEGARGWMVATDRDWDKNPNHLISFRHLWNSTIKKADRALYGWEANPWVWVIEFERISRKEAFANA